MRQPPHPVVPRTNSTHRPQRMGRVGLWPCVAGLLLVALTLRTGPAAFAQETSALINEQLDKQVQLKLDGTLPEALKAIEQQTGVPIRAPAETYAALPWGEQTSIQATIENQTLRQALDALTAKLGLRYELEDETLDVLPVPALERLGRRSTLDELAALDQLRSTPLDPPTPRLSVAKLTELIDQRLTAMKSAYAVEFRAGDTPSAELALFLPKDITLAGALDEIDRQTRVTWYPWGKRIVILPKEEQVRSLLNKSITVRYNGVDVAQVLTELSRRSGVAFTIEPGAVRQLPPESRVVKLLLENVPVRQALESICGFTGLGYVVNENGVYIWNTAAATEARRPRDRMLGILQLDNGMQLLLPESDVPADVRDYLLHKKEAAIVAIREQMKRENYQPATRPADEAARSAEGAAGE